MPARGSSGRASAAVRTPRFSIAVPVVTGNHAIDGAERIALAVLAQNLRHGTHIAAPFYDSAWIRDSFAWGMVPWRGSAASPLSAYSGSELRYWLMRQRQDGLWITNNWSGWYDETPALIAAICDSYLLTGDRRSLRARMPRAERAWSALISTEVHPARGSRYL